MPVQIDGDTTTRKIQGELHRFERRPLVRKLGSSLKIPNGSNHFINIPSDIPIALFLLTK